MWGNHWVCSGGRSPEPTGQQWSALTTNEAISTYSTSDEGGFIFISYKREAYGRPEPQGMLYCIYYQLHQCPLPVFPSTPFHPRTVHRACIDKKIRMLAWPTFQVFVANTFDTHLLIHSYLNSPYNFEIICSFMCIFKLIWLINNVRKVCCSGVVWHHSSQRAPIKCRGWKRGISKHGQSEKMC